MRKIVLMLLCIFSVYLLDAVKVASLPEIINPQRLAADSKKIYISDQYSIFVYSLKTFKLLERIGRKGEGPKEFQSMPSIQLLRDKVFFYTPFRCYLYSKSEKLIEEKKIPMSMKINQVGENFVIYIWNFGTKETVTEISIYTKELKKLKTLYRQKLPFKRDRTKPLNLVGPKLLFICTADKLFLMDGEKGFCVEIYDPDGKQLHVIKREYEKIKITEDQKIKIKEDFLNKWRNRRGRYEYFKKRKYSFPEYFPAVKDLYVSDNKIYIKTFAVKNKKEEYVILDINGNLLKSVFLPEVKMHSYSFKNNNFYYLVENDELEEWELHLEKIE